MISARNLPEKEAEMTTLPHVHRRPYGVERFLRKVEIEAARLELAVAEDTVWNGSKNVGILSEGEGTVAWKRPTSVVYAQEEG